MRRTVTGQVHRPAHLATAPRLLALVTPVCVVALLSGCASQPSSMVNHAASLPAETVVAYTAIASGSPHDVVIGVRGRDGTPLWQTSIDGHADTPPVVVGGVLYSEAKQLQGAAPAGQPPTDTVVAVRLRDGALLWRVSVPAVFVTLTADATSVLVAAGAAGLYALNPADGSIRWHQPLPIGINMLLRQPVAAAGVVVVDPVRGGLTAFRESDGAFLWQAPYGLLNIGMNQLAVYGNVGIFLFAYALADGQKLKDGQPLQQYVNGVWGDDAYDTCCTVHHVSHQAAVLGVSAQLVLVETDVPTDHLLALDARTGQVRWHSTHAVGSVIFASGSGAAPTIYASHEGEVLALRSSDGTFLWQAGVPGYEHGSVLGMIDLGSALFVWLEAPYSSCSLFGCSGPTSNRLVALDTATGAVFWWRDLPTGHMLGQAAPTT
jgi:outer membrane protein assembly factor BamB